MTISQALGMLAGAALAALVGLVLYLGASEGSDGRDLASVAFAGAVVMAFAGLASLFRNLYGSERT